MGLGDAELFKTARKAIDHFEAIAKTNERLEAENQKLSGIGDRNIGEKVKAEEDAVRAGQIIAAARELCTTGSLESIGDAIRKLKEALASFDTLSGRTAKQSQQLGN